MGEKKLLFDTISQKFQNSELSVTAPLLITISFDTRAIMTKTTTPKKKVFMTISTFGGLQSTIICQTAHAFFSFFLCCAKDISVSNTMMASIKLDLCSSHFPAETTVFSFRIWDTATDFSPSPCPALPAGFTYLGFHSAPAFLHGSQQILYQCAAVCLHNPEIRESLSLRGILD